MLKNIEAAMRDLLANFLADFLLGLFFDPEDGGDIFLRSTS
jgi:hypothetical protein